MAAGSVRVARALLTLLPSLMLLAGSCRSRERAGDLAQASEGGAPASGTASERAVVVRHTYVFEGRLVENPWPKDTLVMADGVPLTRKRGMAFVGPWRGSETPRIVVRRGEREKIGACGPYEVPVKIETRRAAFDLELDVLTTEDQDRYRYVYVDTLTHPGGRLGLGQAEMEVPGWSSKSGWFYVPPDCHVDAFTFDGEKLAALPDERADMVIDPGGRTCYARRRVLFPDGGGRTILESRRQPPAKLHVVPRPTQFVVGEAPDQVVTPVTTTEFVRVSCEP